MSGYDYVALQTEPISLTLRPLKALAGVVGLSLVGLASKFAAPHLSLFAGGKGEAGNDGKGGVPGGAFVPKQGVDQVAVKPGPPGPWQMAPSAALGGPHCLFVYGPLRGHVEEAGDMAMGATIEDGWIYGARLNGQPFAYPTGQSGDVVKGQLLCWPALSFKAKLKHADDYWGYDENYPTQSNVKRGILAVVKKSGQTEKAIWYYQEKPLLHTAEWRKGSFWMWRDMSVRYAVVNPEGKGTALLLVHGFGASLEHWRGNVECLAEDRPVYAIDLLGFGFSDQPSSPKSFQRWGGHVWAHQLSDFIDEVIKAPTVLVGNSLGGYSSLLTAAITPHNKNVAGLVLVNSAGPFSAAGEPDPFYRGETITELNLATMDILPPPPTLKEQAGQIVKRVAAYGGFLLTRESRIGQILSVVYTDDKSRVDDDLVDLIKRPAMQPNAYEVFFQTTVGGRGKPGINVRLLLEEIERMKLPTALLWGVNDPWITIKKANVMKAAVPSADLIPLSAGHCPHDEVPDAFNAELNKWLKLQNL
eukprot:gb/GEZN01005029.1/.p1 GENE.gb/GEZN01005029.1/~~gb/GEZN01005029.1/.p1  ORF type:complete len:530 (-),score=57.23 gb/GEZN01005029.1/:221-1810(-)